MHIDYDRLNRYSKKQLIEMLVKENAILIQNPVDAYGPILEKLEAIKFKDKECFVAITLDGAHKVIEMHVVSQGLVNRTLVHPREVFRPAIQDNAVSILLAHNHPSGSLEPSSEDADVTRRLKKSGELLGMPILDHLIVSPSLGYYSFLENERL
jgi:DNA repair protein RadC